VNPRNVSSWSTARMFRNFQLLIGLPDQSTVLLGNLLTGRMTGNEPNFYCLAEFGKGFANRLQIVMVSSVPDALSQGKYPRNAVVNRKILFPFRNRTRFPGCPDGNLVVYWTTLAPKVVADLMLFCWLDLSYSILLITKLYLTFRIMNILSCVLHYNNGSYIIFFCHLDTKRIHG
jgi:hypothetical protein